MIRQFRAIWHNDATTILSHDDPALDTQFGPRSAGKVARWSLERVADILRRNSRGKLNIERRPEIPMTPHERSLSIVLEHLAEGETHRAKQHAQWLVRSPACDALIRALQPVSQGPVRQALS